MKVPWVVIHKKHWKKIDEYAQKIDSEKLFLKREYMSVFLVKALTNTELNCLFKKVATAEILTDI